MFANYRTISSFSSRARKLRAEFEDVYADPRLTHPKRFMWDDWYLKDQFRHHRTLARNFFSTRHFEPFLKQLIQFGQDHLGCHSVSEPWLSYYTDGDEQRLHTDSPHGPWAYVYSLTPNSATFEGGKTIMLREDILSFWNHPNVTQRNRGLEFDDLFVKTKPHFNQLLIFDPRIPHGVEQVRGPLDPRKGRLVIHGWFVKPEAFVTGSLKRAAVSQALNRQLQKVLQPVPLESTSGISTFRLQITTAGKVRTCKTQSLQWRDMDGKPHTKLARQTENALSMLNFPKATGASILRLPLIVN